MRTSTRSLFSRPAATLVLLALSVVQISGYQVVVSDSDPIRQICSGIYAGGPQNASIEVQFSPVSRGQLALVIYESNDAKYLGVEADGSKSGDKWSEERTFICTLDALDAKLCAESDLGSFIVSNSTDSSIFTTSVRFSSVPSAPVNTAGNRQARLGPYHYDVRKTGYYCVGTVPVLLQGAQTNSSFFGVIEFTNGFFGHLPASEYPKVHFYFTLFLIYAAIALVWTSFAYRHRRDLLRLQNYITAIVLFVTFEMFMVWRYYSYLNKDGHPGVAGILLLFVAILNAARNSLSFFMLLVVSMGYGLLRPNLGSVMIKIRLLSFVHFCFGMLYTLGVYLIPLESSGFFIFFFILPLAFSLTGFLMWIMWSLNSTIADLGARRQTYKRTMFTRLYRILMFAIVVVFAFFLITSLSFNSRLSANLSAKSWQFSWFLVEGWLAVLYLVVFGCIAYLWRPSLGNQRLALSDELPMDEMQADEYEIDEEGDDFDTESNGRGAKGESFPLRGVKEDQVVFNVGSDGEDEDEAETGRLNRRRSNSSNEDSGDITNNMQSPPSYSKRD